MKTTILLILHALNYKLNVHRLSTTVFDFIYYFDYFYCMSFSSQQRMLQHHNNCFNIPIACEQYPPPNML